MDLSQFKKVSESKTHTVLKHKDGHEVRLQHNKLSKEECNKLSSMGVQKYADGGDVDPQSEGGLPSISDAWKVMSAPDAGTQASPSDAPGQISQGNPSMGPFGTLSQATFPVREQMQQDAHPQVNEDLERAPQSAPVDQDPYGIDKMANQERGALRSGGQAMTAIGKAEGQVAKDQSVVADKAVQEQQKTAAWYQAHYEALEGERQKFQKDVSEGKIDPNHYINNLSTAHSIMTGIGLFISGAGQSMHNTNFNPALEMLNKNIDRDIAAQQSNLGISKTLLESNYKQFGNLRDATDMTRTMMKDATATQMQAAALKQGNPLAIQQAQLAKAKWDMEGAKTMQDITQRQVMMKQMAAMNQGQAGADNSPAGISQKLEFMKRMGLVDDKQYSAAIEELHGHANHESQSQAIMGDFEKMVKQRGDATTYLGRNSPANNAYNMHIMAPLRDAEGRINDEGMKRLGAMVPSKFDSASRINQNRAALTMFLREKAPKTGTLESLGLMPRASKPIQEKKPNTRGR